MIVWQEPLFRTALLFVNDGLLVGAQGTAKSRRVSTIRASIIGLDWLGSSPRYGTCPHLLRLGKLFVECAKKPRIFFVEVRQVSCHFFDDRFDTWFLTMRVCEVMRDLWDADV